MKTLKTITVIASIALFALACTACRMPTSSDSVTGLGLVPDTIRILVGETYRELTPRIYPEDVLDPALIWESSDKSLVTVDENGHVTGLAEGFATITVFTANRAHSALCDIEVYDDPSLLRVLYVNLDPPTLDLLVDETFTLTKTITPSNAWIQSVTWSSSDEKIAKVDADGVVTGVAKGEAIITVKADDGGSTDTCVVTVTVPLLEINIGENFGIEVGDIRPLTVTYLPDGAEKVPVTWSSSNENFATVDNDGIVTGIAAGVATIMATTDSGISDTCTVTVTDPPPNTIPVEGINLEGPASIELPVGDIRDLIATVSPAGATNPTVYWSSSNPSFASVNGSGRVTAIAVGTATITARTAEGNHTASCTVTVYAQVDGISLNQSTLRVPVGETRILIANVSPSNARDKTVNWSTDYDHASTGLTSQSGASMTINGNSVGTTIITVTANDTSKGTHSAICTVTVYQPVIRVTINPKPLTLYMGNTKQLTADVYPDNAENKKVYWSSLDPTVATVSTNGVVTPGKIGTTTITVTTDDGNKTDTCDVTVKERLITTVFVEKGTFELGKELEDQSNRVNLFADVKNLTTVHITTDFYMGKYPVTQDEYASLMGNPSLFTSSNIAANETNGRRPVENVSWYDAIKFCNLLSIEEGLSPAYSINGSTDPNSSAWGSVPTSLNTAWNNVTVVPNSTGYRLPTQSQWEFAAKGGNEGIKYDKFSFAGSNTLDSVAWHSTNSGARTHEVGKRVGNRLGLFDMTGNVWEYCWDWRTSASSPHPGGTVYDYTGVAQSSAYDNNRMSKGGNFQTAGSPSRNTGYNFGKQPHVRGNDSGFRVLRPAP